MEENENGNCVSCCFFFYFYVKLTTKCILKCLPGPMNSIISVNGIITQKARMNKHPRRRRGDAVNPIFILDNFKHLKQDKEKLLKKNKVLCFIFKIDKNSKCQLTQ